MSMTEELLAPIIIILFGGTLSVFLCIYGTLTFKNSPGGRYYIILSLLASLFSFAYIFELVSTSIERIMFWIKIEYIPLALIPVFTLLMCIEYVGLQLKRSIFYSLFLIPVITLLLQATNDFHHLYYTSMKLRSDSPFPMADLEYGLWFGVHSAFLYGCMIAGVTVLLRGLLGAHRPQFRIQILVMVFGLMVPLMGGFLYLMELSPYGIDLGPVFTSISFIFHGIALLRYQMFDVIPIARDIVFTNMEDGIVVLNEKEMVVDYNQAMLDIVPTLHKKAIGMQISEVFSGYPELIPIIEAGRDQDQQFLHSGVTRYYHIHFAPIRNKHKERIGTIVSFANITERVVMEEKLKELADTDSLTGMLNKRALMRESENYLNKLSQSGGSFSMIMFDVDYFKQVNDKIGHEAGDIVLTHVAEAVKTNIQPVHIAGRYGGDEFILCLPETSLTEAYKVADSIRAHIAEKCMLVNGKEVRVTSSFGVTHVHMQQGESLPLITLMRQADEALYMAKEKGRNCVHPYSKAS
ncbi:GGDEF domain-containing protein [Paenibacillus sp. J45TS6]|uniref:histidine kinase N-terminal 7TM domain-containing diguanylate cyclase n=1 Tax=Paenibacillus sp. J45TS6 TaxID=2807196 RepID=UPI001AFD49CE|nr:histidine kinase N-terminal 7TM domain-containing protein [Paenibacillus sp. J45TS6]GIP42442.1 GGDEF domain-containing protein [Paenibacillus sp. J45TS6]